MADAGPPAPIALLILAVEDLPRAAAFYDAAFGWEVGWNEPVYREYRLPGGTGLSLYARAGFAANTGLTPAAVPPGATTSTEIYLRVADLEAACARLRAAGARELSPPADRVWGDRAAYFADPDGNVIGVAVVLPEA